jgi:phospholipid/cholesterol/gamma-HCH transport system substrate-binding protein
MSDLIKNMMIGIFVVCALAIVVFVMMFLHPNVGDEGEVIKVRFANIDKISEGTRVTFGGRAVGEITDIEEIPLGKNPRQARDGSVYVYELTLRIDSGIKVYITDEFSARTSGLLGEKSVAIIPRPVAPGEKLVPVDGRVMYATEMGSVEDTIKEFKEVADKLDIALDNVNDAFNDIKRNKLFDHVGNVAKNLSDITVALNKPDEWADTLSNIHEVSQRATKSWDKVDESLGNVTEATHDLKIVFKDVQEGKGSVGKIIVNDDMYLRISSLLSKAEVTLDDVNHYGLLFHNDKGWQRLRARRLNLMQKLCTPQEFRNFFNDEVDQISASLARVAMVLSNSDPCCPCFELWNNPDYVKLYADLIRRVDMLDEYVNMFNTQVVSHDVQKTELAPAAQCEGCYEGYYCE